MVLWLFLGMGLGVSLGMRLGMGLGVSLGVRLDFPAAVVRVRVVCAVLAAVFALKRVALPMGGGHGHKAQENCACKFHSEGHSQRRAFCEQVQWGICKSRWSSTFYTLVLSLSQHMLPCCGILGPDANQIDMSH